MTARQRAGGDRPTVILTADDYAMTEGVSHAIETLARAGRLSATSAMTTSRHWPAHAARIASSRDTLAIGLHFDLTLLGPLGAMPRLAPAGRLPVVSALTRAALARRIDADEVAAEADRQLDAFEHHLGHPPDHIDGHQHVHALPVVRHAVMNVLQRRYPGRRVLVRVPADRLWRIRARGRAVVKSIILAGLAAGFAGDVGSAGFPTNDGFAGVSDFEIGGVADDFAAAAITPGALHLVMCHPGFVDDELRRIDPVRERRRAEFELLMDERATPFKVWRATRSAEGWIDWQAARGGNA